MKNYQIVIHIFALLFLNASFIYAQDSLETTIKHPKLYQIQQKYLNWIDKKDKEKPFVHRRRCRNRRSWPGRPPAHRR